MPRARTPAVVTKGVVPRWPGRAVLFVLLFGLGARAFMGCTPPPPAGPTSAERGLPVATDQGPAAAPPPPTPTITPRPPTATPPLATATPPPTQPPPTPSPTAAPRSTTFTIDEATL